MNKYLIVNKFRRPGTYPYTKVEIVTASSVAAALSSQSYDDYVSTTDLAKLVRSGDVWKDTEAVYELKSDTNLLEDL